MGNCFTTEITQGVFHVYLRGDIDAACEDELQEIVIAYADSAWANVVVDLGDVTFFGIPGLRLLNFLAGQTRRRDRNLTLQRVPPMPWRVIHTAGPAEALPDEPDAADPCDHLDLIDGRPIRYRWEEAEVLTP